MADQWLTSGTSELVWSVFQSAPLEEADDAASPAAHHQPAGAAAHRQPAGAAAHHQTAGAAAHHQPASATAPLSGCGSFDYISDSQLQDISLMYA